MIKTVKSFSFHRMGFPILCGLLLLLIPAFNSCKTSKCVLCDADQSKLYLVEFKEEAKKQYGKIKVETFFAPIPLEIGKNKVNLFMIDCDTIEPFRYSQDELDEMVKKRTIIIDTTLVRKILTTSDADLPPVMVEYASLKANLLCNRFRKPFKFELKGMLGSRFPWSDEGLFYPGVGDEGGITYKRPFLGFGPGGTNLTLGAEAALLPRLALLKNRHSFNLGLLTGYWPVDGGHWTPLSLHPRLTFNEVASPLRGKCNAWFIYGDVGPVIKWANIGSGNTRIPSFGDQLSDWFKSPWNDLQTASWFAGIGAGVDFWKSKGHDLSFDFGYRVTNLKLPKNEAFEDCLDLSGREVNYPYPSRQAGQFYVRFGFTW